MDNKGLFSQNMNYSVINQDSDSCPPPQPPLDFVFTRKTKIHKLYSDIIVSPPRETDTTVSSQVWILIFRREVKDNVQHLEANDSSLSVSLSLCFYLFYVIVK